MLHAAFIPFFEHLISKNLTRKTIKRHGDNIWLLGGEIIARTYDDESLRERGGLEVVLEFIDESGGPYSKHLDTEEDFESFDRSCRKLYKFLSTLSTADTD